MKRIQIPGHVKSFIREELSNYNTYKNLIDEYERDIIEESGHSEVQSQKTNKKVSIVENKVLKIESSEDLNIYKTKVENMKRAYDNLKDKDKELARSIFLEGHTYIYCKVHEYIEKDTYYRVANTMIYLTAREYKLI